MFPILIYSSVTLICSYIGLIFSTICIIPQIIKIYKTKNARDISKLTYLFFLISQIFFLIRYFYITEIAAIITCLVNFLIGLIVFFQIYYYKKVGN